jgi:transposase-like protein
MLPGFKNLKELTTKFSDESICRQYLEDMIWQGNPTCPHCGHHHPYKLKDGKTYRCKSKTCKKDFTITVGTIFEGSNVPLSKWFIAIYIATNHKKGISSIQLGKDIGVTQRTAWFMLHRIREMVKPKQEPFLQGEIMVDETFVGGKVKNKSNTKRRQIINGERPVDEKTPVFGLLEKGGQAILKVVPDIKIETLHPIIIDSVDSSSTIVTDGAIGHTRLKSDFADHRIVIHSESEYIRDGFTTNHIESVFAIVKRTIIGTYHQVSPKHLQSYCNECGYRYNTRKMKDNYRFMDVLQNSDGRLKYNDLIAKKSN